MSSRLLRNLLNCRRYSRQLKRQSSIASYATGTSRESCFYRTMPEIQYNRNLLSTLTANSCQVKSFTTETSSTERQPKSADTLLVQIISNYKNFGYILPQQCTKLLEVLEAESDEAVSESLTPENIEFLLHAIGTRLLTETTLERMTFFQRLWLVLQQHNLLSNHAYIERLKVLQHNRIPLEDFQAYLKEISVSNADLLKTPLLFNELLLTACSAGNMQQATEILTKMRARNFALNEQNFNALILGHGRNRDLNGCKTTLESMQAAGVPASNDTQTTLLITYLENEDKPKALEILQKFHGQFSGEQILSILRTALNVDLDGDITRLLVRELPTDYTAGPDLSFNLRQLCNDLIHNGKFEVIKSIVAALPNPTFNENQSIDSYGNSILTELFRAQVPEQKILELAQLLIESNKNPRALHVATDIAMRRSPPTALPFLEALAEVEPLRSHYFWPLMMYNFRRHGESGIITTLRHMQRLNVACDNETIGQYVLPHLSITLENPTQGIKMLADAGVKVSTLLTPVLRHLIRQQKVFEAITVLESHPMKIDISGQLMPMLLQLSVNIRATKRYQQFAKLLNELSKHNETPKIDFVGQLLLSMLTKQERLQQNMRSFQRFVLEMQKVGLRISHSAANNLLSFLSEIKNAKPDQPDADQVSQISQILQQMKDRVLSLSQHDANGGQGNSTFAKHPRDMNLDDLECHLIELESKGMNTRGVLRRLLQLYVRENQLNKALEIKAKCDNLRVQESPGMLASIFDLHIKMGDLPQAEETLSKLQKLYPGFQIDEHKFIDYAALLVNENLLEISFQMLAERSAKGKVSGGDYVLKNVWNFLTNVAHLAARQDPPLPPETNLTRQAFEFMRKHGYCTNSNAILGPIVREYLLRGDLNAAVDVFQQLADHHKHTPLQFELLSLLVRLCNGNAKENAQFSVTTEGAQKLLSDVTTTVTKVHGSTNMNSALILAFAESGTDNQLRRLLINPEFRINHDILQKNCEHLGKEGAVRTLLRLAKGARGLSRSINEQTIYNSLLSNFVKLNDYEAALDLYDRLEADDELKISTEFLKNLVSLLKVNKIEVPSNVALRARII